MLFGLGYQYMVIIHAICSEIHSLQVIIVKSTQSGVTLCFPFISTTVSGSATLSMSSPTSVSASASASSIAMTFASHVKTVWAINLRYLGQRKYQSGIMYWMTFWWPWPKVTAVTLINKNLLVCKINWEPLNQLLQSLVVIFFGHAYYLSRFWRNSIRNFFLPNFLWKFRMCIFKIIHSIVQA